MVYFNITITSANDNIQLFQNDINSNSIINFINVFLNIKENFYQYKSFSEEEIINIINDLKYKQSKEIKRNYGILSIEINYNNDITNYYFTNKYYFSRHTIYDFDWIKKIKEIVYKL
jgi:hypothetical protein